MEPLLGLEQNKALQALKDEVDRNSVIFTNEISAINGILHNFLRLGLFCGVPGTYNSVSSDLDDKILQMETAVFRMKEANNVLVKDFPSANMHSTISVAESNMVSSINKIEEFKRFSQKICALPFSIMLDEGSYGNINRSFWNAICGMARTDVVRYISICEQNLSNTQHFYEIDIEKVLECVWFFAIEKPFSASDFQKAKNVFHRVYKQIHVDTVIADLYVKKSIGGEDVLRVQVLDLLNKRLSPRFLTLVASSLMWMNAYQTELAVLQRMLSAGKEMTAKMQERLHSLSTGGGKIPGGFDVMSSANVFYFDVSALAWKDDEYVGLFENLAFKDKTLTYALAIREENKELFIPQGINIPDAAGIVNKINSVFSEEYGNSVTVRSANCIALSGSGEEKLEGVLVSPCDCRQMGILMYMARIGKKLIIRFYTLFVPHGSDLAVQKQQALSLYKKLSPSAAMWESSLKDTMLMAVEQLLNSSVQGNDTPTNNPAGGMGNNPIF